MNDLRKIVYFLIGLFFITRFFLIPLIKIIVNLFKLGTLRKQINKLGSEILKEPIILIYLLFFVPALLDMILITQYSKYNGFYSNGIVNGSFLEWKEIFSWKKIDEDKLSFLKQDGLRFDMETNLKQKLIIDFMIEKGIQEEK